MGEKKCHCCKEGSDGACGWAYMACRVCGDVFCADYFYRWYVVRYISCLPLIVVQVAGPGHIPAPYASNDRAAGLDDTKGKEGEAHRPKVRLPTR